MADKKRMGIFVFYDKYGIVSDYIDYLLKSMNEVLERLVIVINGAVNEEGIIIFRKFSDEIYIRENVGYDAGALKDAFTNYLKEEAWEIWDEVVIFNDTFYGPLVSWKYVFHKMEKQNLDFWGLSKWYSAKSSYDGKIIPEHIQSYFLVLDSKIIIHHAFQDFWNDMSYPTAYRAAIESYETKLTGHLKQIGFTCNTWIETQCGDKYMDESSVVYIEHGYELIRDSQFPVIKKRAISVQNWNQSRDILAYVKENTDYDLHLILDHLERKDKEGEVRPFSANKIKKFVLQHDKVFIYGAGKIGRSIERYLNDIGIEIQAFIVSRKNNERENVIEYREFSLKENDGIIVGVGRKYWREIYTMLIEDCPEKNLLLPEYDSY